ncbi:MAG: amidase [Chloroflexota bacterium]
MMGDERLEEATIADLQQWMQSGQLTSRHLVDWYLARIESLDRNGPTLRSIIEINPDAQATADELDRERVATGPRGPLHGIPILLKDNIDSADRMRTTAGSLALIGAVPFEDAHVTMRLRHAGAILLGKANMSEWANFRSSHSSSGWSARGGQGRNPYALDRTPCGSSSGSAQSVAANLSTVSLGTETNGSILCPASINGVVGIKPTVGLTSRAGVIPIAHSQDTVGPFGRTVADAAAVLGAIAGRDDRDSATAKIPDELSLDYALSLAVAGLEGARIGVMRENYFGYSEKADAVIELSLKVMRDLGAVVVDPANIPSAKEMREQHQAEMDVLLYEFKADLNTYLAGLKVTPVRTLQDVIDFNERHAEEEMPFFKQELLLMAQEKGPLTDAAYLEALGTIRRLSREEGIDAVMNEHRLDALVAPSTSPAWKIDLIDGDHGMGGSAGPSALAGYPAISVPAGFTHGLPVGITFTGRAFSEATLLRLAHAFEQATKLRRKPDFIAAT